jgi:hypothetical protein
MVGERMGRGGRVRFELSWKGRRDMICTIVNCDYWASLGEEK